MSNKRKNRGSILIMVVGMLTVLFMLGLTFLAVCHMNAKQAEATAATSQVEPVSGGVVAQVRNVLRDGRYLNQANGPYGSLGGGAAGWKNYILYPAFDNGTPALTVTPWLSSSDPNYFGTAITPVDTNGDGVADAYLFDTGVTNNNGDKYYAAVRIEDLSGRFNVNVASDGTAITPVNYPSAVNLSNFIAAEGGNYNNINTARGGAADINAYSLNCARRLYSPGGSYRPFGIGDEAFLRWMKLTPNMTQNGRLYGANFLPADTYTDKDKRARRLGNLTTINCSSSIPRSPSKDFPTKTYIKGYSATDASTAMDTDEARQRLYKQLAGAFGGDSTSDSVPNNKAAHLVANMWANLDYQAVAGDGSFTNPTKSYKFQPTGAEWHVYGVTEQPVITEAFAYYLPSSPEALADTPVKDDHAWAIGVEIMNPTLVDIPMRDNAGPLYYITCGTQTYTLDKDSSNNNITKLSPGQRVVIYTVGGKSPADASRPRTLPAAIGDFGFTMTAPSIWVATPETTPGDPTTNILNSFGTQPLNLYRKAEYGAVSAATPTTITDSGKSWLPLNTWRNAKVYIVSGLGAGQLRTITTSNNDTLTVPAWTIQPDNTSRYCIISIPMDTVSAGMTGFPAIDVTQSNDSTAGGNEKIADGRRDDWIDGVATDGKPRNRAIVQLMKVIPTPLRQYGATGQLLGAPTTAKGVAFGDIAAFEGFALRLDHSTPTNLGVLGNLYVCGPYRDTNSSAEKSLPMSLMTVATTVARGKLDFRGTGLGSGTYPDIPEGLLFEEFLAGNEADSTRGDEPGLATRHYGKINVNTAPKEVIQRLPFPANITNPITGANVAVDAGRAADYIIAYRDKTAVSGTSKTYATPITTRSDIKGANLAGLRASANSDCKGYFSASELAIPLADYANELMGWSDYASAQPQAGGIDLTKLNGYLDARDAIYKAVSNMVTVSGDVFAATIRVELWKNGEVPGTVGKNPLYTWNYLAILDRSNVTFSREGGTVTAASATTLTDSGKTWTISWVGRQVQISSGKGVGQIRTITGSTANTLTVGTAWEITPDNTSKYCIIYSPTIFPQPAVLMFTKLTD